MVITIPHAPATRMLAGAKERSPEKMRRKLLGSDSARLQCEETNKNSNVSAHHEGGVRPVQKLDNPKLPPESGQMTEAALWLLAAQLLSDLEADSGDTPITPEQVSVAPPVEFDTTIRCHNTPECSALRFPSIQDYQRHLMAHSVAQPSAAPAESSSTTVVEKTSPRGYPNMARAQQMPQLRERHIPQMRVADEARQRRSLPMALVTGRRRSLHARMAALSLVDKRASSALSANNHAADIATESLKFAQPAN